MKNLINKKKITLLAKFVLLAVTLFYSNITNAALRTINCSTVAEIKAAMANAKPGDEIIIAPGTYNSDAKVKDGFGKFNYFSGLADGTSANPIIIRGASSTNLPKLRVPSNLEFVSPILGITGDYWIIKDLEISHGQRGLILDTASHCKIINVTIHSTGQEGLHLRTSSKNNLVQNCRIYNCGISDPGTGEGIYIGSDKNSHSTYAPDCDNNTIEGCIIGPNVRAEGIDVKEGTQYTIIRNCTFDATGISGENSGDAFIDLKGGYTFVYNNVFNANNAPILASCIDFQQRTGTNSGFRNAVFNNTFNLGTSKSGIPTARKKGGTPSQIHIWGNTRNPSSPDFPISDGTLSLVTQSCPSWNIIPCGNGGGGGESNTPPTVAISSPTGGSFNAGTNITITANASDSDGISKVAFFNGSTLLGEDTSSPYQYTISNVSVGNYSITARATDTKNATTTSATVNFTVNSVVINPPGGCKFNTPTNTSLSSFDKITFNKMYILGSGGPLASNFKKFQINWNLSTNSLVQFAYSTNNGSPDYYVDLRTKIVQNFSSAQPSLKITGSGISGLDGDYWVTKNGTDFVMVSKNNGYTLYFSNSATPPNVSCARLTGTEEKNNLTTEITVYPNPTNGYVNLNGIGTDVNLMVMDLQGKVVFDKKISKDNIINLDFSNLNNGLYLFKFNSETINQTQRIIIQK